MAAGLVLHGEAVISLREGHGQMGREVKNENRNGGIALTKNVGAIAYIQQLMSVFQLVKLSLVSVLPLL